MKRLLALLLVSLFLFAMIACDTTPKEPLPDKPATELMPLVKNKMAAYTAYEMTTKATTEADSGDKTTMTNVARRAGDDGYMSSEGTLFASDGSSVKQKVVVTVVGEDAYMDVDIPGITRKVKTSAEDDTVLDFFPPTMEEIINYLAGADYSTATVKAGTDTWTITLGEAITMLPDEEDPDYPDDDVTVKNAVTVLVIDRNYNLKSITVAYDYEQAGETATVKTTIKVSRLGTAKVTIPKDADTYGSMR